MRTTAILAVAALLSLAATPATKPDKPTPYTLEQIIKAVPKADKPAGGGEWTAAQVKTYSDAIAAVLEGKTVTFKGLSVGLVTPKKDGMEFTAGSEHKAINDLYAVLVVETVLGGRDAETVGKLNAKQPVAVTGKADKVKVELQQRRMATGHSTTVRVTLSDATVTPAR